MEPPVFPDPLNVRTNAAKIIKKLSFVTINQAKLSYLAEKLNQARMANKLLTEAQFGQLKNSPQKIFLLDTVNFCFWAKKGKAKWSIEYPEKNIVDGYQALVACFDRALAEKIPLLDTKFLSRITLDETRHIFRSCNQVRIPLLDQRRQFFQQSAKILQQKFAGSADNLIKQANYSAPRIARLIIAHFPSFNDPGFFKRAQICAYDLSLLPNSPISQTSQLTVFADYKLPQVLRFFGAISYEKSLAEKIDKLILIDPGSREEIEIRAATVWVGELLSQQLQLPAVTIDNLIWYLSQTLNGGIKPHHRTLTINY
jgi:hypothetical protein